jgi:uncharacterized membrane protein YgcG
MKRLLLAVLVPFLVTTGAALALTEYTLTAHVNDFAGIVPAQTRAELEQRLHSYKEATTIEIVVVTVPSLEGISVEDFTIRLAQKAGIGSKEKDNGIVFLVAPNDRKVRIEVGYGLEPDLTDLQSKRILTEHVTPRFKEGKFSQGISDGITAILAELGDTPFRQRQEERRVAAEKKNQQDAQDAENFRAVLGYVGTVITLAGILVAMVISIKVSTRRKRERLGLITENATSIQDCMHALAEAIEDHRKAQQVVENLKKTHAPRAWKDLVPKHSQTKLQNCMTGLVETATGSLEMLREQQRGLASLKREILDFTGFPRLVAERIAKLAQLKEASIQLSKHPPDLVALEAAGVHPDVTPDTRKLITCTRDLLIQAKQFGASPGLPDYMTLGEKISAVIDSIGRVTKAIASDRHAAEMARAQGPELLQTLPETLLTAQKQIGGGNSSAAKQLLEKASEDFISASKACESTPTDWPRCFPLLVAVGTTIKAALAREASDKEKKEQEERRRRRRRSGSSSSSYHSSSSSSSSSYDSGGSSSIGGGGSFGGGGGSDSW